MAEFRANKLDALLGDLVSRMQQRWADDFAADTEASHAPQS